MAKKKVRKEEEEEEFGPPPFDEKQFYEGELGTAKATLLSALWGTLMALATAGAFAVTRDFIIGIGVGLAGVIAIKPLLDLVKVVTKGWGATKWLGSGLSYFACWLAFWILLVNPPVLDMSSPVLKDETPHVQELGTRLRLDIHAVDNTAISSLTATVRGPDGTERTLTDFMEEGDSLYKLELGSNLTGYYNYSVRAEDLSGHSGAVSGELRVVPALPPEMELIAPSNGSDITLQTSIMLHITDNGLAQLVSGVHYRLDNGTEQVLVKQQKKGYQSYRDGIYIIKPNQPGQQWQGGLHTLTVEATDAIGLMTAVNYNFTLR